MNTDEYKYIVYYNCEKCKRQVGRRTKICGEIVNIKICCLCKD